MGAGRGKPINLALQGGGAHGAFTWGVLDRLLEEQHFQIMCISAASAGAINALALASGYLDGGPDGARARLASLWGGIEKSGVPDFVRSMSRGPMAQMMSVFSPYEFNPLNFDPLRSLLLDHIDFKHLRRAPPFALMIAATEVATGRARLFRENEITVDMALASACLPTLHHAVEIDGQHYWDGGFSANPDLVQLAGAGFAGDTILVQLLPMFRRLNPTRAREIAGQVSLITFTQPLVRDSAVIAEIQSRGRLALWGAPRTSQRIAGHRFHLIDASPYTRRLGFETMAEPDSGLFAHLRDAGRREASNWLNKSGKLVGVRSSIDLAKRFLGPVDLDGQIEDAI